MSRFGGPTVSRPGKADCSKLALALARLALHHGEQPGVNTLADVTAAVRKDFPEVRHEDVVSALVESTRGSPKTTTDLQDKIDTLKRQARREYRTMDAPAKERLQGQIKELQAKLDAPPEVAPIKSDRLPVSKEVQRLEFQRDTLKKQVRQRINDLKPRTFWGNVVEGANLARGLLASEDFSGLLRQGGFAAASHPIRTAAAAVDMFKAAMSDQALYRQQKELAARPNAPLYDRYKLAITDLDGPLSSREEGFVSRTLSKVPGIRASNRAMVGLLNRVRADSFDAMQETLASKGGFTDAEGRAASNWANVTTGRGPLGGLEQMASALNGVFFSPRNWASRVQLMVGQPLYGGSARTRVYIAGEYGKFIAGMGVVYALGSAAGADIETDPRSSDFGKLRFGDTRVDPLMGISQNIVLGSRLISGETKTGRGDIVDIRGPNVPYRGQKADDLLKNTIRNKLAPVPGLAWDIVKGEHPMGEPVTAKSVARNVAVPISFQDIYQQMTENGIPEGAAFSLLTIFGMGVQKYETKQPGKTKGHQPTGITQ